MYLKSQSTINTFKLAVCGLGLVGRRHLKAIEQVTDACCVAVVDPFLEDTETIQISDVDTFSNLSDMIAKARPDGIILATPNVLHISQALECIAAGIPVLIEKPVSDDLVSAQRFEHDIKGLDVPVLVGHHRRHNPLIQKAKSLIAGGRIGDIRAVSGTCWFYKPDDYFNTTPWRKQKGAGPVSVNLVHDIDLIRFLCGEVQSVQAQACLSKRGYENEDVASAVLRFENDVIGTISVSDSVVAPWSWEMTSSEYPIYPRTSQSSYIIGGSEGSLSVPDLTLWKHIEEPDWWSPISATSVPCEQSDPLVNQILNFCGVIRGDEKPLVSLTEGVRTLEVVDAIHRASRTGETVHLSSDMGKTRAAELQAAQM
jgi:predicted dehydrogenase